MLIETYKDNEVLSKFLADAIVSILKKSQEPSLILSGGSTPLPLYKELARSEMSWERVKITTCDEHFLPEESYGRNDVSIKTNFISHLGGDVSFFSLLDVDSINSTTYIEENFPISPDVLVLGLWVGGHTASIFPDAKEKNDLLFGDKSLYLVNSQLAKTKRITFGLNRLLMAKNIFLHIVGKDKMNLLVNALVLNKLEEMPISAFLFRPNFKIFWSPE